MDFDYNIPIYIQVSDDIKKKLVRGFLNPGDRLPSAADLSVEYHINPNTAQRIFKNLEAEGIIFTRRGIGTFITEDAIKIESLKKDIVDRLVGRFVSEMKEIGYSHQDIIEYIKKKGDFNGNA